MRDFRRCSIRSPMDGMVVMQTTYRGGQMNQIKVGDRLSPGQPFMRVVDPASMQLDATMNQAESEMVRLNQNAMVRFDAFPEIVVEGPREGRGRACPGRPPRQFQRAQCAGAACAGHGRSARNSGSFGERRYRNGGARRRSDRSAWKRSAIRAGRRSCTSNRARRLWRAKSRSAARPIRTSRLCRAFRKATKSPCSPRSRLP